MFCELDAPPEKEKEEPVGLAVKVVPSSDNFDADLETSAVDSPPPINRDKIYFLTILSKCDD